MVARIKLCVRVCISPYCYLALEGIAWYTFLSGFHTLPSCNLIMYLFMCEDQKLLPRSNSCLQTPGFHTILYTLNTTTSHPHPPNPQKYTPSRKKEKSEWNKFGRSLVSHLWQLARKVTKITTTRYVHCVYVHVLGAHTAIAHCGISYFSA